MAGPANDHVFIQVQIDSLGLARQPFGEQIFLTHKQAFAERVRHFGSYAAAVPGVFAADSPEGLAIGAAFAQTPKPRRVAVGRCIGTVTKQFTLGLVTPATVTVGATYGFDVDGEGVTPTEVRYTALADLDFAPGDVNTGTDAITEVAHGMLSGAGPFRLSNSGGALPTGTGIAVDTNVFIIAATDDTYKLATSKANALAGTAIDITAAGTGTHTLRRAQNDVVIAQLVTQANAVTGANYTAAQVTGAGETDTMTVTGNAANNWFALAITNRSLLAITETHAAPSGVTLATDLAAILQEDRSWFCINTFYNSEAYIKDVSSWAESNDRMYIADTVDTTVPGTVLSGATDVGADLLALGRKNTGMNYGRHPALMLAPGITARWLATDPGKSNPKFKTISGVIGDTFTDQEKTNLRNKRVNFYEQVLSDKPFYQEGTVFSTENRFLLITRNAMWLSSEAQLALLEVFTANEIVALSPEGIAMMEGALVGVGDLAFRQGVLVAQPTIEAPDFEDLEAADIAEGNLVGLKMNGSLTVPMQKAIPVTLILTF